MSDIRQYTFCRCGRQSNSRNDTVCFQIGERTIRVHHVPHFRCSSCERVIYGEVVGLVELVRCAFRNEWDEVDYSRGAEVLITFQIEIDEIHKRQIEEVVFTQIPKIDNGDEFAVITGDRVYLGIRTGDQFLITKMISKVL